MDQLHKHHYIINSHNPLITRTVYNLQNAVAHIYKSLLSVHSEEWANIELVHYYMNIPIVTFNVDFEKTLILKNAENKICTTSIYPEFTQFDILLLNKIGKQKYQHKNAIINDRPAQILPIVKNNNTGIANKITSENTKNAFHKRFLENIKSNTTEKNKPLDIQTIHQNNNQNENNINNPKLRLFSSDKKAYYKVKKDIDNGIISAEEINPLFTLKYQILRVIDNRKILNLDNDDNITKEYDIFMEIHDEYLNDNNIATEKVYIPHNYHYMSKEKKEEHAKKYRMSLRQFEDKYIKCTTSDNLIDNHIQNGSLDSGKSDTNKKKSSVSESQSEDSDETSSLSENTEYDKPKIDPVFVELSKEYNKKSNLVIV